MNSSVSFCMFSDGDISNKCDEFQENLKMVGDIFWNPYAIGEFDYKNRVF